MDESVVVERKLPIGVVQKKDKTNLYWVNPMDLFFADGGFDPDSDKLEYRNIRYALSNQKLVGKGLERETMSRLAERIRVEGLHQYPICRWFEEGVQVVDGERRTRAILKLIADNAQCWDKDAKQWVSAKDLYGKIAVFVFDMTDEEALKINFSASESGENFGDGAVVAYVKYLRKCNMEDKEILSLTGHHAEWLKQTDKLCDLDDDTFQALCNSKITRGLAINLLDIDDVDTRLSELNQRIELAEKRWVAEKGKLETKKEKIGDKLEILKEEEKSAVKEDNPEVAEKVSKKKKKVSDSLKTTAEKLKQHEETQPKAGAKTDPEPKPLTYAKIQINWLDVVTEILQNDCKDGEGNDLEIEREDLILTKLLCDQQRKGQKDIVRILKAHHKHKTERAAKTQGVTAE